MTAAGGLPLLLTRDGPGSRPAIEAYIAQVIRERTVPNADTSAERLAVVITTSVLHRLGAYYPVAAGLPGAESLFPRSEIPAASRPTRDDALAEALNLAMTRADLYDMPADLDDMPADLIAARAAMARVWLEIADRMGESPPEVAPEWRGTADAPPQYGRCSHGNICLINGDHLVHPLGDRCTDPPDPHRTREERSC